MRHPSGVNPVAGKRNYVAFSVGPGHARRLPVLLRGAPAGCEWHVLRRHPLPESHRTQRRRVTVRGPWRNAATSWKLARRSNETLPVPWN